MKKHPQNLKRLNLSFLSCTNCTHLIGEFEMPALYCNSKVLPDFLALYSEPGNYHRTPLTGVCFYSFDNVFDGPNGLYWAIRHGVKDRLDFFRERFKDVHFLITPDYSILGDIPRIENLRRMFDARLVGVWFQTETDAVVIPNISFLDEEDAPIALAGLEDCTMVAISTKGHMNSNSKRERMEANIHIVVDTIHPSAIIVYDTCASDENARALFRYAEGQGVNVIIPPNTLKACNKRQRLQREAQK